MDDRERRKKSAVALGIVFIILVSGVTMAWANYYYAQLKVTRVACVGDSITQGSTYTKQLQLLLGYNYSVGNFGIAGATVARDAKIPYIYQTQFRQAIDFKPNIVLIMLGTNDANPEISHNETTFTNDYNYIVTSFQDLDSKPQIVLVDSPKMFVSSSSSYNDSYLINNVIPEVNDLADQLNLTTVDMYHAFAEHPDYYLDGVHPNEQGSTLIASSMYDVVTSLQEDGQN